MKTLYKYLAILLIGVMIMPQMLLAGNKDRSGQSGASELLINPWARSSGWGSANMARVHGLEAMWGNVGGTIFTKKTQVSFAHTQWLKGTGTNLFAFGLSQRVSESGVFGMQVMSMNFGDIEVTTTDNPDGGLGTYSPSLINFALSYAKSFSNSISAGVVFKIISEGMSDITAVGVAVDIGIQYVTGENDQFAFGVSLKNIGPTMKYSGDGLSLKAFIPGQETQFTVEHRSEDFEIPAQLNIGASYDFLFGQELRLTPALTFVSNSFTKDQFAFGMEFSMKDWVMIRGGYTYEKGIWDDMLSSERSNISSGLSLGATVQVPINKEKGSFFSVDYSYHETSSFSGNHTIGIIMNF